MVGELAEGSASRTGGGCHTGIHAFRAGGVLFQLAGEEFGDAGDVVGVVVAAGPFGVAEIGGLRPVLELAAGEDVAAIGDLDFFKHFDAGFEGGCQGMDDEAVPVGAAQGDDAAGFEDAPNFAQGRDGFLQMLKDGVGKDDVEGAGGEGEFVDGAGEEAGVLDFVFRGVLAGEGQLAFGEVQGGEFAGGDDSGEADGDGARAAADVEEALAGFQVRQGKAGLAFGGAAGHEGDGAGGVAGGVGFARGGVGCWCRVHRRSLSTGMFS